MVGKQVVTKDQLEAFGRKLRQSISGASVTTIYQTGESIANFTELADVPQSYTGFGGCILAVNNAATAVDFNQYTTVSDAAPTLTIRNKTDSEVDPIIQWSLGATPVVKFTAGVDDSDGDAWKLSAGSALGTTDRIIITATPRIGLFTNAPQAPIHYITPTPGTAPDIIFEETGVGYSMQLRLKNTTRSWDIGSDASPDGLGFRDVEADHFPLFFQGVTGNIGLWWQTGAQWDAGGGSFGTGSPAKIISIKDDSVWPTAQSADQLCLGGFSIKSAAALGILSGAEVASYFGNCWFLNDTANADMTCGVTLNCGAAVDQILAFKYNFNNAQFQNLVEVDTFADFRVNTVNGGIEINGYSAASVARGDYSFYVTGNTALTTAGFASHTLYSGKADGSGTYGNCAATDNIFALRPYYGGGWLSCFIVNATGNSWQSGSIIAQGGLTLGLNGAGGAAGVITLRDGANPGTTATLSYAKWADLEAVNGIVKCDGSGDYSAAAAGDLPAHSVLSASHGDSTAAAVVRGDIIIGSGATPKWTRLAKGTETYVLTMGADEPAWAVLPAAGPHNLLSATHSDSTAGAAVAGDIIYADDTPKWTKLAHGNDGDVLTLAAGLPSWAAGSSGSGDSMTKAVAQAGHGLSVGNAVKCTGANTYAKAQADSAANAEVVGIVASSADGDNFVLLMGGYWASASVPAQAAGTVMYLSPTSAGAMTATEPTTDGQISKPIGVIVENGAKMLIFNWRGVELDTLQVTGADLGDSFGVTAVKLQNTIITTFTNRAYAFQNLASCASAGAMFTGLINSGGTGGLTATNVPYDGDSNEAMLVPYPAVTVDGRIVLHNTTRGTSRLVTAIDTANNFITTVSTADAWADNDALTMESQTCTAGAVRFCDLDLSGMIPATATAVYMEVGVSDSAGAGALIRLHPYEAYAAGKIQQFYGQVAGNPYYGRAWVKVTSQRVCIDWGSSAGAATLTGYFRIFGWQENADT